MENFLNNEYYDGGKLLSLKDKDGDPPLLYFCVGNRTGGKTTWFNRYLLKSFLVRQQKFMLLFRHSYELTGAVNNFFDSIKNLFFEDYVMKQKPVNKGLFFILEVALKYRYCERTHKAIEIAEEDLIFLECGFAVSLTNADKLKRSSNMFSEVKNVFFDEFMTESNRYLTNETRLLRSLIVSVSRGNHQHYRHVSWFFASNSVSLLNPYFLEFRISNHLQKNTKFLRGRGWVLEQSIIESASKALKESPIARAFGDSDGYIAYATELEYLDNKNFIEQLRGSNFEKIATILHDNTYYSIRIYAGDILYITKAKDDNEYTYVCYNNYHTEDTILLSSNHILISIVKRAFTQGKLKFKDMECKNLFFEMVYPKDFDNHLK